MLGVEEFSNRDSLIEKCLGQMLGDSMCVGVSPKDSIGHTGRQ